MFNQRYLIVLMNNIYISVITEYTIIMEKESLMSTFIKAPEIEKRPTLAIAFNG